MKAPPTWLLSKSTSSVFCRCHCPLLPRRPRELIVPGGGDVDDLRDGAEILNLHRLAAAGRNRSIPLCRRTGFPRRRRPRNRNEALLLGRTHRGVMTGWVVAARAGAAKLPLARSDGVSNRSVPLATVVAPP